MTKFNRTIKGTRILAGKPSRSTIAHRLSESEAKNAVANAIATGWTDVCSYIYEPQEEFDIVPISEKLEYDFSEN